MIRSLRAAAASLMLVAASCNGQREEVEDVDNAPEAAELATGGSGAGAGPAAPALEPTDSAVTPPNSERDRAIFAETMERALQERLDTLSIGDRVVALGRWFVGARYTPGTLEVGPPERLIVDLDDFDCVTYVETMLAMARALEDGQPSYAEFLAELRRIRYRDGLIDGYDSRLHYFSDWIADNERLGIVRDITRELGGVPTDEPIDFMTSNREKYPALADDQAEYERMREIERTLNGRTRHYIPKARIAEVAPRIQNGDIIAATSSIEGLDIAHTGIAAWVGGELHLMHAPLVGSMVEVSELPLAERIARIDGQDGIMVARPIGR